jgi:hypothetical protein
MLTCGDNVVDDPLAFICATRVDFSSGGRVELTASRVNFSSGGRVVVVLTANRVNFSSGGLFVLTSIRVNFSSGGWVVVLSSIRVNFSSDGRVVSSAEGPRTIVLHWALLGLSLTLGSANILRVTSGMMCTFATDARRTEDES